MEALHSGSCDITISIDCDGQDDINAMDEMVQKYLDGAEVVYGVRSRRDTDTFFKRFTAEGFYHVMNALAPTSCSITPTTALSAPVCWRALPTTTR